MNDRNKVNLSTPEPEGRGLPSTRAQAEGLKVHPEPRPFTPSSKAGLRAAERVKKLSVLTLIDMNPNKMGALEEYAFHLSKTLLEKGHLAMVGFAEYPPPWLMEKFKQAGIRVLRLSSSDGAIPFIIRLRKIIEDYGLNIVHATFYPFYSPVLMVASMGNRCKLIYSDQMSRISHSSRDFKSLLRFLKNRFLQKYVYTIIADAEFIRESQIRDFHTKPDKTSVVYNGVNLKRFAKADPAQKSETLRKLGVAPDTSVIVSIAQCIKAKGLGYLIEGAEMICQERPNSIFFIIGDGPERSALVQQATALGLQDKVIFTGMRTDTEMFLSIADVFVLLSVWEEAFAFTLLEAMASSCPVVATRRGAIPESILDGVTGILVPPQDAKATAEAILKLLNDETLRQRIGLAGRERVERYFSLERWVGETIRIYEKAVSS